MAPSWAARADKNQQEIVDGLRAAGRTVVSLHRVGGGVPDLLVGFRGHNYLLEVKTASGKLTQKQIEFITDWRGQMKTVRTIGEAIDATQGC